MSDAAVVRSSTCRPCSRALYHRVGLMAGRLEALLGALPSARDRLQGGLEFLRSLHADALAHPPSEPSPRLTRLRTRFGLTELEEELLVLAGLAEDHEGLASVLAELHPRGESWPTIGLGAQLLAPTPGMRTVLRDALETGPLHRGGLVLQDGSGPFHTRSLRVGPELWSSLQGRDLWPEVLGRTPRPGPGLGFGPWLEEAGATGVACLRESRPATLHISSDSSDWGVDAGVALASAAGCRWAWFVPRRFSAGEARSLVAHVTARGVVPILMLQESLEGRMEGLSALTALPGPVVLVGPAPGVRLDSGRSLLRLPAPGSHEVDRRGMWSSLAPELGGAVEELAGSLRLPPGVAAAVVDDARRRAGLEERSLTPRDVTASLRGRVGAELTRGARLVRPAVAWEDLVLAPEARGQLEEAAGRLGHQVQVLDEWGFLKGRVGARGVRMLLHGPPGTGKSMAAEAVAARVGVDLLVVDLSQIVSKWIGETEKNLGAVFDAAEESQAVLLFDEADALFAQRTEVGDSRDRYANLETSYLLTRLERFEGLAVLSTNIKRNIDPAFLRRLDFVVEFPVPSEEDREAIWAGHVPDDMPRADDVSFPEMARRYPVAGGLIRNAALGAAFLAAANGRTLTRDHLSHSIRREYAKAGLAFPGPLPGTAEP